MNIMLARFCSKLANSNAVAITAIIILTNLFTAVIRVPAIAENTDNSAAVRARVEKYQSVWNTRDAAAVSKFFAEGAYFVMGNLPAVHGRKAISEWWRAYFSRQEPGRTGTFDITAIKFVAADVASVSIASTTGGLDAQGEKLLVRKARGAWLIRRQNGDWFIESLLGFPTVQDSLELKGSIESAESLRPRIRALVHDYERAFDTHDPIAISGFYTDDADVMVRNLPAIHGKQAIVEWWQKYFSKLKSDRLAPENWYDSMQSVLIIDDIEMITPAVALINITATAAARQPEAELSPLRYARATWVLVRQNGQWKISTLWVLPGEEDHIIRESDR